MITLNHSVQFFDEQFQRQATTGDLALNPFEEVALPHLRGRVLDFGCGMGNLAVAAARRGCSVVALDGSSAAIGHLQRRARRDSLAIDAAQADLRTFEVTEDFDTIVSIGLLMFFDCSTAFRSLANLQARVRKGGVAINCSQIFSRQVSRSNGSGARGDCCSVFEIGRASCRERV